MENLSSYLNASSLLIGGATITFLYIIYWYQRPKNFPPGPRGLPLVGYLPFLSKRLESDVAKLSEKLGPIISVRMGPTDMVFLNDFESIQQALVKNGSSFSGRGRFASMEAIKKGHGIVFSDYSEPWKEQRRFGLMTLRGFGVGKKGMENICLEELFYLNEEIQKMNGKPFNISSIIHKAISNNICNITFGKRFHYDDKDFVRMMNIVIEVFDDPFISFTNRLLIMVPLAKHIPPFSYFYNKFHNMLKELFAWFKQNADEHKKTFDPNNIRDFIDAFIQEKRKGKESSFSNWQLINYIHELFVAGTETTSSTLYWALLCFLHYPETQKKLRNEVITVFGSSGSASMSKKSEMPYTNAFIQELMRFRTLVPLSVAHKTNFDSNLQEYFIPKGTTIHPNLWAVHNDPNLWKNSDIFNPERFLDKEGNFVQSKYVIPFSVGPRHCLGEQLAKMEVFIFLVGLVQKFEFLSDPNSNELPTIDNGSLGGVFIPIPYKVIAKEY